MQPSMPPPVAPRQHRRGVLIAMIVAVAIVVLIAAALAVAVIGFGLDLGFVALVALIIVTGALSFALRFLPQGLPGIRLARAGLSFVRGRGRGGP